MFGKRRASVRIAVVVAIAVLVLVAATIAVTLWLAHVKSERALACKVVVGNGLKQIGLALQIYEGAKGRLPPAVIHGPDGTPLLGSLRSKWSIAATIWVILNRSEDGDAIQKSAIFACAFLFHRTK